MILCRAQRVAPRRRRSNQHIGGRGEKGHLKPRRRVVGLHRQPLREVLSGQDHSRLNKECREDWELQLMHART